eukprot:1436074-Rhodomonas_salina.4
MLHCICCASFFKSPSSQPKSLICRVGLSVQTAAATAAIEGAATARSRALPEKISAMKRATSCSGCAWLAFSTSQSHTQSGPTTAARGESTRTCCFFSAASFRRIRRGRDFPSHPIGQRGGVAGVHGAANEVADVPPRAEADQQPRQLDLDGCAGHGAWKGRAVHARVLRCAALLRHLHVLLVLLLHRRDGRGRRRGPGGESERGVE